MTSVPADADDAVSELFRAHYASMVRLAWLLLRDPALAEDVAQEAFVDLHQRWSKLRDPDKAVEYVRSAVLNRSRSRIRSLVRRRARESLLTVDEPVADGPESALLGEALLAKVRALPQRQREVVVLRYWAELSEAEIAATLGISAGSVKSHASRALAALSISVEDLR